MPVLGEGTVPSGIPSARSGPSARYRELARGIHNLFLNPFQNNLLRRFKTLKKIDTQMQHAFEGSKEEHKRYRDIIDE